MDDAQIRTHLVEVIRKLSNTLKGVRIYPLTHPKTVEAIKGLLSDLNILFKEEEMVKIGVFQDELLYEGKPLPATSASLDLARALYMRGITGINLSKGVNQEEISSLLELLALIPKKVRDEGGPVSFFNKRRTLHISLTEVDYGDLLKEEGEDLPWLEKKLVLARYLSGESLGEEEVGFLTTQLFNDPSLISGILPEVVRRKGIGVLKRGVEIAELKEVFSKFSDEEIARIMNLAIEIGDIEGLDEILEKIIPGEERRKKVVQIIKHNLLAEAERPGFDMRWRLMKRTFEEERFIPKVYEETLHRLGLTLPKTPLDNVSDLIAAFSQESIQESETELLLTLSSFSVDEEYKSFISKLKERAIVYISNKNYKLAAEILGTFSSELETKKDTFLKESIEEIGSQSTIESLIEDIPSSSKEIRNEIAQTLIFFGEQSGHLLMERLSVEGNVFVRRHILNILTKIDQPVLSELKSWLSDERWYVVRNAAYILSRKKDKKIIHYLSPLISHKDDRVKREAVFGLGRLGGEDALELLIKVFQSKNRSIRYYSIISMRNLGDPRIIPLFIDLLKTKDLLKRRANEKLEAIKTLGMMKAVSAVPILTKILKSKTWFFEKDEDPLRLSALEALAEIGTKEAFEAITWASERGKGSFRNKSLEILKRSQGPKGFV